MYMKSIQEEIKQTRPFASLESEASVSLARTAAVIENAFAGLIKPYGITPTLYNILRILRGAGEAGLCRYEVADRMVTMAPDVTRLLDRLERKGYITRDRDSENRRLVKATITQAGLDLLRQLDDKVEEFNARQFGHLGRERLQTLIEALAATRTST
jgi:DNA-binding MarR family transcriptional regulator